MTRNEFEHAIRAAGAIKMIHTQRRRTLVLALILAAGCTASPGGGPGGDDEDVCPPPGGEFPPTDCALVRGVAKDGRGQGLSSIPIRVDSIVHPNFVYGSSPTTSGVDGRFSLTVFRVARLRPPTDPDTATIDLKTYATPNPLPRDSATSRASVVMHFAPLGQPVTVSIVEAIFRP